MQKFGIGNLKLAIIGAASLSSVAFGIDKNQDGQIDLGEKWSAGQKGLEVVGSFKGLNYDQLKKEVQDLDAKELQELRLTFNKYFDLPEAKDGAELKVERLVELTVETVNMLNKWYVFAKTSRPKNIVESAQAKPPAKLPPKKA